MARKVLDARSPSRDAAVEKPATKPGPEVALNDRLPRRRRLRRRFWFEVTRAVLGAVQALPERPGRGFCRVLAAAGLRIRSRERARARRNLALVFPDRPWDWREALLRRSADSLGETLHAMLTADRRAARGFPGVREEPGPDGRGALAVLRDLTAGGRGALLVTGHLGCWELLGAWCARGLPRTAVVTGTVRNPAVDRLLQDRRRALGVEPLPRERGAGPVLRALDRGAAVGVLIDQNTRVASAPLPFLGATAPTPLGPARIARRRGVPILPAAMIREADGWVVRHLQPIDPADAASDEELAGRCNAALGELILRNPDQWVWFHDRWDLERQAGREAASGPAPSVEDTGRERP
jgi:KDO2-lipid IV(A) lauroyltransferase